MSGANLVERLLDAVDTMEVAMDTPIENITADSPALRVVLSPTETREWKNFTDYMNGTRLDGWTDPAGRKWIVASTYDTAELLVRFDDSYLPPLYLVRLENSRRFKKGR